MRANSLKGKPVQPIPTDDKEVMVEEIKKISKAVQHLANSKMTRETIEVLIQHKCRVSRKNIAKVLDTAMNLETLYLKPDETEQTKKKLTRIDS